MSIHYVSTSVHEYLGVFQWVVTEIDEGRYTDWVLDRKAKNGELFECRDGSFIQPIFWRLGYLHERTHWSDYWEKYIDVEDLIEGPCIDPVAHAEGAHDC